jgi:hypothetical protein
METSAKRWSLFVGVQLAILSATALMFAAAPKLGNCLQNLHG